MKEEMLEILMWARINKEKRQRDYGYRRLYGDAGA
jgi:hypothetical protein